MSDLHILLTGWDDDITSIGNALLGRKAFIEELKVTQRHSVRLQDKRHLYITAPLGGQSVRGPDNERRLIDEIVTEIKSTDCHALMLAVVISSNLNLLGNYVWNVARQDDYLRELIRNKGVIVVLEANTFKQAQKEEKISVTFPQWMAQQGGAEGELVQFVQGRCLLFDTRGNKDVLFTQHKEFIDIIDRWVFELKKSTVLKFRETKFTQIEQQLSNLNQRISALEQQEKTNFLKLEKMNQLLKTNLLEMRTEIKEHKQEVRQQLAIISRKATKESEDTEKKLSELLKNLQAENTKRTIALNEERKRLEATENELSVLKRKRRE